MKHREELDRLLQTYETYVGAGSMKQAGRLLPTIIRQLVNLMEERMGNPQPTKLQKEYQDFIKQDKKVSLPEPCAPCDVSIPDNDQLIEDFKLDTILESPERTVFRLDVGDMPPEQALSTLLTAIEEKKAEAKPKAAAKPKAKPKKKTPAAAKKAVTKAPKKI